MRIALRPSRSSAGTLTGLALALAACADPMSPRPGIDASPVAAIGSDNSSPLQETFGTGVQTSGDRDTRFDVCYGGGCPPGSFIDAYVLTRNQRWAYPIGYPGNTKAPASIQTRWIGPTNDANQFLSEPRQDDVYQTTFNLPVDGAGAALNVRLYADNQATVYVNGVKIGQQSAGGTHDGDHYPNYGCGYLVPAHYCGAPDLGSVGDEDDFSAAAKALYNSLGNPNWVAPVAYTTTGDAVPFNYGGSNTLRIVVHNAEFKQGCAVRTDDPRCPSATGLDLLAELRYDFDLGSQGCTPGYWKQSHHFDSWRAPYDPGDLITSVFPAAGTGDQTLLDALQGGGGSGVAGAKKILLRAAVAAVLNAASSNVDYTMSVGDIQAAVHLALTSNSRDAMLELAAKLDADNNLGCPLN